MFRFALPSVLVVLTLGSMYILSAPSTPATVVVDTVFAGRASVSDGDTIRIGDTRIRLHGIDTPERDQDCTTEHGFPFACGDVATDVLRARLAGQQVTCQHIEYDRYDRSVARCYVDGADIGQEMVAAGYAIAYRRYSTEYVADEQAAQASGAGFWSANMQAPAVHRANARAAPPPPNPACVIKGNISGSGQIFHVPGQEFYDQTRINLGAGERWFCTSQEAIAEGWRPARR
jgi:endonuclease YncB( thermonuclease family)